MHKLTMIGSMVLILALLNFSIFQREEHLEKGELVYLKLAPVDPRSLMQGDYMALNFGMARDISNALPHNTSYGRFWRRDVKSNDGCVVVHLDKRKVAFFDHISKGYKLEKNQMLLQYRVRGGEVKFASNAFFFEEGTGERYEKAKFGAFRVNAKHELLLVSLYDDNLTKIN